MSEPARTLAADLERGIALALAGVAALIGVTCASRGGLEPRTSTPVASATFPRADARAPMPAAEPSTPLLALGSAELKPPRGPAVNDPTQLALSHFYANLTGLGPRTRDSPVRILWLGDSHTAADYLTGKVRARLQARFGAGGPGFLRVGLKSYRHTQVQVGCDGPWRVEPPQPSRRAPFDDAIFGLGGMRSSPDGAPAGASFALRPGAAHGRIHWQVWYSLADGGSFRVSLGGVSQVIGKSTAEVEIPGSGFASLPLDSALSDRLELVTLGGAPKFYGVIAEGSDPGLVLDTVGIDGARVATALAWSEPSFEAALRSRGPSLVVLAFGTNEAFDGDKLDKYRGQYQELLARVQNAAPTADCLLLGLPDANAVGGGSEPRVAELDALQRSIASELGCGFVSQLAIMGGPGGYSSWANQSPSLARGDRLHLSPKGYEVIADAVSDRLLAAYDAQLPHAPH